MKTYTVEYVRIPGSLVGTHSSIPDGEYVSLADYQALEQVITNYRQIEANLIELRDKQVAMLDNCLPIAQPVTTNEQAAIEAARQGEALLLLVLGWEARQMENQRQLEARREG